MEYKLYETVTSEEFSVVRQEGTRQVQRKKHEIKSEENVAYCAKKCYPIRDKRLHKVVIRFAGNNYGHCEKGKGFCLNGFTGDCR